MTTGEAAVDETALADIVQAVLFVTAHDKTNTPNTLISLLIS